MVILCQNTKFWSAAAKLIPANIASFTVCTSVIFEFTTFYPFHCIQCDYKKAVESFGQCCQICSELDDTEALHEARVQYGIARGHQMMGNFSSVVSDCTGCGLESLVNWKDARMAPGTTTTSEQQDVADIETVNDEVGEDKETSDTSNPTQSQTISDST